MNTLPHNIIRYISHISVSILLLFILFKDSSGLGIQSYIFITITILLSVWAFFCLRMSDCSFKTEKSDVIAIVIFIYVTINFLYISERIWFINYLHFCLLSSMYFSLRIIFSSCKFSYNYILDSIVTLGIIESITGIVQYYFYQENATGSFLNSGPYGGFLACTNIAAQIKLQNYYRPCKLIYISFRKNASYIINYESNGKHYISYALFLISLYVVLLIQNRAALLCIFTGTLIISYKNIRIYLPRMHIDKRAIIYASVLTATLLLSIALYKTKKASADGRILIWKISNNILAERPIEGVGLGNYMSTYSQKQAQYFQSAHPSSYEIKIAGTPGFAFNEYLQFSIEFGFIGLLLFTVFICLIINTQIRNSDLIVHLLIGILVFAFFSYPFRVLPIQVLCLILCAFKSTEETNCKSTSIGKYIICILAICPSFFASFFYLRKIDAYQKWQYMLHSSSRAIIEVRSPKDFAYLYQDLNDDPNFLLDYGTFLHTTGDYHLSNNILLKGAQLTGSMEYFCILGANMMNMGNYSLAEYYFRRASYIIPNRLYPHYLLAKLYCLQGNERQAIEKARNVINMTPKVQSPDADRLKAEMHNLLQTLE